jgi:4-diphosphocytidyl-2-C-methyl-D-erythritol kinase
VERTVSTGRLVCPAFAKVNLGLEVLGVRQDGYHELRTVFQTIDLADEVALTPTSGECRIACDHPDVPSDERNLALRAALDLRTYASAGPGVSIELCKRIPPGGGLGGGSSDAAATLLGLDHLWGLGLGREGLLPLARRLGADVPYFLSGGTALGISRGDEVYPLATQVQAWVVLVDAGRPVSTAAVFRRVDATLTPRENSTSISRFVAGKMAGGLAYGALVNDLERAALEEAPDLAKGVESVRAVLGREGAQSTLMSGSGSTWFGLFSGRREGSRARKALASAGFAAVLARTLSLGGYRRAWARALGGPSR